MQQPPKENPEPPPPYVPPEHQHSLPAASEVELVAREAISCLEVVTYLWSTGRRPGDGELDALERDIARFWRVVGGKV